MRGAQQLKGDEGSGSILAVAVFAGTLCIAALLLPLSSVLLATQRAAAAADLSALAAADVVAGIAGGTPCAVAARVALANGAALGDCEMSGAVVTISTSLTVLGFGVVAWASAGPAS